MPSQSRHLEDSNSQLWRASRRESYAWATWDGEAVIYDDLSGDTIKLDAFATALFKQLQVSPANQAQLSEYIASAFDLTADMRLEELVALALKKLQTANLIEPARCSEGLDTNAKATDL